MLPKEQVIELLEKNLGKLKRSYENGGTVNIGQNFGRVEALLGVLGGLDINVPVSNLREDIKGKYMTTKEDSELTLIRMAEKFLEKQQK